MAKHHPLHAAAGPGALSAPGSPASASPSARLSLQLRQDLAKLADRDPDTRRSSMDALKGFIEEQLDSRSMPTFLEQVSGESSKGSSSYAILLFVEVARVHKQFTVPFIPRIMAAVLRSLSSSPGGAGHSNNLHQACAKVVSAVARYAIEPASSWDSSSPMDVLNSLCQPLLGRLCSNVEPMSIGSATCLQAVVEAENWKFAAPELVNDVCYKSSMSLVQKGKQTVAHMHLVRSLAKFNSRALQEYGASLLKVGLDILVAVAAGGGGTPSCMGGSSSWQQRVAAAQLLGTLLGCLDQRILVSELLRTTETLDRCRLDKVTMVRQAAGEALTIAKTLASQIDPLFLPNDASEDATTVSPPPYNRPPDSRKHVTRRKRLWRAEESSGLTNAMDDIVPGSQESQLVSHASSPSSSITTVSTPSLASPSPPSVASSATRIGRSPLYPAKQSPAFPPSTDRYMAESDLHYILDRLKLSDSKENATLVGKSGEPLLSTRSDDISYLLYSGGSKVSKENRGDEEVVDTIDAHPCTTEFERDSLLSEEHVEANNVEADSSSERHINSDNVSSKSLDAVCEQEMHLSERRTREICLDHAASTLVDEYPENGSSKAVKNTQCDGGQEKCDDLMTQNHYDSFAQLLNSPEVAHSQGTKKRMSAEDFLIFSTPRRLVRSLQSVSSTPDSKCLLEDDLRADLDFETLSESGWSVRDNPIAGDSEEDSPRMTSIPGLLCRKDMLTKSVENPLLNGTCLDNLTVTQLEELPFCSSDKDVRVSESADHSDLVSEASVSSHPICSGLDVLGHGNLEDSSLKGQREGNFGCDPAGYAIPNTESAQSNPFQEKWTFGWLTQKVSRDWTVCARRLRKMHCYVEMFLFGALLIVLAFTTFIAILNCINGQRDLHVLVPT